MNHSEMYKDRDAYRELSRRFSCLVVELVGLDVYTTDKFIKKEMYSRYKDEVTLEYNKVRKELTDLTTRLNIKHELTDRKIIITKGIEELNNVIKEGNNDMEIKQAKLDIYRHENALKDITKKKKFFGVF